MSARILTDLTEVSRMSERSVGSLGKQLAALDQKAIPIPTSVIIPQETLATVIDELGILRTLRDLSQHTDPEDSMARYQLRERALQLIRQAQLPGWFGKDVLDTYHRFLGRGFVRIRSGQIDPRLTMGIHEHVQGDANLIESLLIFWSRQVELELVRSFRFKLDTFTPSSIILQAQTQAEASGVAYTLNPETGLRQHFYFEAIWGCPDTELMETAPDSYVLDNRSHAVVMRRVGTQTHYYRRRQDGVERIDIPSEHQSKPVLPDELCSELSRILQRIKRQNIHHAKVAWELTPTGFEITEYTPYHDFAPREAKTSQHRATKVFITGGNPYKTKLDPLHQADGLGVLRSEYTYLSFGIHPHVAIKNRQREALQQKLLLAIKTFKSAVHGKPVLFRSLFVTSKELLQLDYAGSEEPVEPNPFLGWRGGLRLTHQPQLLEFELSVIRAAIEQTGSTVGYIVPFVRQPQELDRILLTIKQQGLKQQANFQAWWQLNTPENVISISRYPTTELDGIIIHQHTIQALLQGIDPTNPDITDRYSHDPEAFMQLMERSIPEFQRLQQLRPDKPLTILLYLEQFEPELVAQAVRLRLDGIIVKPTALAIALESVAEYEHTQLLHI